MAIILILTNENGQTSELPITGKCVVGRSSSCDFTINDKQMSGKHGCFEIGSSGELFYSDLGSTNGSFLNNSQIHKVQFRTNEVLLLGNTTITIDEKKLTTKERVSIGRGIADDTGKTIVLPSATRSLVRETALPPATPQASESKEAPKPKKGIVLNKDLKKKIKSDLTTIKADNLIEQEASSGVTKFLKLDLFKKKKK